jgi:hypothetical protein
MLALFEADAGAPTDAQKLIDEAAATGVARPRIYFHQARFRFLEERAKVAKPDDKFTLEQTRHIFAPLETALAQRPALSEVYRAAAEIWAHCDTPPPAEVVEKLRTGPRLFPRDAVLAQYVATLLLQSGMASEAKHVVEQALNVAADEKGSRERLLRLRDAIDRVAPKTDAR